MNLGLDDVVNELRNPTTSPQFKQFLSIYARALLRSNRPKCHKALGDLPTFIFKEKNENLITCSPLHVLPFLIFSGFSFSSLSLKDFPKLYLQLCLLTLNTVPINTSLWQISPNL